MRGEPRRAREQRRQRGSSAPCKDSAAEGPAPSPCLARPDDARGVELVHGIHQFGVRHHRLLRLLRVLLQRLQEHLDLRVVHDLLNLRIGHCMADLFLIDLAAIRLRDLHDDLLLAPLAFLVVWLDREALVVGLQGFVVLLHEEVGGTLPGIGLHECGIQPQALLDVLERIGMCHELSQGGRAIRVELGIRRVPLDRLVVLCLGVSILVPLEELVALLLVHLGLRWVEVALLLMLLLGALQLPEGISGLPVVVLCQGFVVHPNGRLEILPFLEDGRNPIEDLCHLLEGGAAWVGGVDLVAALDDVPERCERSVVVLGAHLDEDRTLVVDVREVVGLLLDSLVVHLESLLELLLLVELVALILEIVGLLLRRGAVVWRLFLLRLLLFGRRPGWRPALRRVPRRALDVAVGAHRGDVDALHGHDDLQDAGVLLHRLHEHLLLHGRVALPQLHHHGDLLHQVRVLHVLLDLWVLGRGSGQRSGVEVAEEAAAAAAAAAHPGARDLVLGVGGLLQALLERRVLWRELETGLVSVDCVVVLPQEVLGQALACVTFRPIRLQLHTLGAVLKCLIILRQRRIAS
mmetsp:Transcript_59672/g.194705  ORF Transcript_59672/g.194705 Transcript_59672/m.194705 type:complete len:577 (-) Transcript_59672:225-1955(-)